MKKTALILSATLLAFTGFAAQAAEQRTGCAAKKQDIEQQIQQAKAYGNSGRIAGLEKALAEVMAHCTDENLLKQRQANVAEKQRKVQAREQELNATEAEGKAQKIEKKREKLQEARAELKQAEAELTQ